MGGRSAAFSVGSGNSSTHLHAQILFGDASYHRVRRKWRPGTGRGGGRNYLALATSPLPQNTVLRAGGVTPDLWPGPRPEERLASSCSTSSSCPKSLKRINLLVIGDHRSLGVRSPRLCKDQEAGAQESREGEWDVGDLSRISEPGEREPATPAGDKLREGKLCLPASPVRTTESEELRSVPDGPVLLGRNWRCPPHTASAQTHHAEG